jgi:hypothetical protein
MIRKLHHSLRIPLDALIGSPGARRHSAAYR